MGKNPRLHLARLLRRRGLRPVRIEERDGRAVLFVERDPEAARSARPGMLAGGDQQLQEPDLPGLEDLDAKQ